MSIYLIGRLEMRKLSVLLPALAADSALESALASSLLGLPNNSEILVSIEQSADPVLEAKYSEKPVRFFWSARKRPLSEALNLLVFEAQGEFIARIDADDICLPDRFTIQLDAISRLDCDFLFGSAKLNYQFKGNVSVTIPAPRYALNTSQVKYLAKQNNPLLHPTMLCKASSLKKLGGYKDVEIEDYDLWLRALLEGMSIEKIRNYAIVHRIHENQKSKISQHIVSDVEFQNLDSLRNELTEVSTLNFYATFSRLSDLYNFLVFKTASFAKKKIYNLKNFYKPVNKR